MKPGYHK